MFTHKSKVTLACAVAVAIGSGFSQVQAAPANLGSGLDRILKMYKDNPKGFIAAARSTKWFMADENGKVMVNIHLDGTVPLDKVKAFAAAHDAEAVAEDATYSRGVVSIWVHPSQIEAISKAPGVSSVITVPRPHTNVGLVTAQGAAVHHTDLVNKPGTIKPNGVKGTGITIGIMSDSYNKAKKVEKADQGVAQGDLPGVGNAAYPQPVVVLADIPRQYVLLGAATDEGRGMAEIAHDLAPAAKLCFATAYPSDVAFANNIKALRTDSRALCDIICDDVSYTTEPMFSDGIIAKAVNEVVSNTTDAGKKVAYFSSAGNAGANGYSDTFRLVTPTAAKALTNQNLKLTSVPAALYAGGFHNFNSAGGTADISQKLTSSGADSSIVFEWDDPFDIPGGMTSDYNILVFDMAGNYLPDISMVTNNFTTNEPVEWPLTLTAGVSYQIAICRTAQGSHTAARLRYVEPQATLAGDYLSPKTPTTYGHNSSELGSGVAAYVYDSNPSAAGNTPELESYSSNGPVTICFDGSGKRLATAVVRSKPDFACADGQDTSFFPPGDISTTDYDGNGFPNFFGTSAASPTAAAIAALVLETAGGPGKITPLQIKNYMKGSVGGATYRDFDPRLATATVTSGATSVTMTSNGDDPLDPNFFHVNFHGASGQSLTKLVLNVKPAGLELDPDPETGYPFTIGATVGVSKTGITHSLTVPTTSGGFQTLTINLPVNDVVAADAFNFGIDRDIANVGSSGNSADLLEDATATFTVTGIGTLTATFANVFGSGYLYADGLGFINALNACTAAKP